VYTVRSYIKIFHNWEKRASCMSVWGDKAVMSSWLKAFHSIFTINAYLVDWGLWVRFCPHPHFDVCGRSGLVHKTTRSRSFDWESEYNNNKLFTKNKNCFSPSRFGCCSNVFKRYVEGGRGRRWLGDVSYIKDGAGLRVWVFFCMCVLTRKM